MLRALGITAALLFLGALGGAVGGAIAPVLGNIIIKGSSPTLEQWPAILAYAGYFGGFCGIIAAPVVWWSALRAIPPWRGGLETGVATGFAAQFTVGITSANVYSVCVMATFGAALAALRLRRQFLGD